jgi:hypothetical protein
VTGPWRVLVDRTRAAAQESGAGQGTPALDSRE